MPLSHLLQCVWWLWYTWAEWDQLCLWFLEATVASTLWDVISALPMAAVPGAPSEQWFAQVALAVAADGMAGAGHRTWRSILIFFSGAPVPSPELCPVKVEKSVILVLYTIPSPGEFSSSGVPAILTHPSCLLEVPPQLIQPISFLTAASHSSCMSRNYS